MKVGVFHPGTQHSWQTALAFQEASQLSWYATSVLFDRRRWPDRALPLFPEVISAPLLRELGRRSFPRLDPALVRRFGFREWLAVPMRRLRMHQAATRLTLANSAAGARHVTALMKQSKIDMLWTYDSFALEALRSAKAAGISTVLDQTIGHMASLNKVLHDEQAVHPQLFPERWSGLDPELLERQREELDLADRIVVGSDFCARTLLENGVPTRKVHVLRYGYDEALFPCVPEASIAEKFNDKNTQTIKFITVGSIGARKGSKYLIDAFAQMQADPVELVMVGPVECDISALGRLPSNVKILPSVPRDQIRHHIMQAHCMILPSLFEGCSLSLLEGVACGLPVIHSTSSGDGIVDGNGLVISSVDADAISEAVRKVVSQPPGLYAMAEVSRQRASQLSSESYRARVREFAQL